jgi:hypothetical protein
MYAQHERPDPIQLEGRSCRKRHIRVRRMDVAGNAVKRSAPTSQPIACPGSCDISLTIFMPTRYARCA